MASCIIICMNAIFELLYIGCYGYALDEKKDIIISDKKIIFSAELVCLSVCIYLSVSNIINELQWKLMRESGMVKEQDSD